MLPSSVCSFPGCLCIVACLICLLNVSTSVEMTIGPILKVLSSDFEHRFTANDGKMKLKGILPSSVESEILSGSIQNLGLIRILDYTLNEIPNKLDK